MRKATFAFICALFIVISSLKAQENDSVAYWKRCASVELYSAGWVFDFDSQQKYGDHMSLGFLNITLGITKNEHPLLFSAGLSSIQGRPFLDLLSLKKEHMNVPSFRMGIRVLKTDHFEVALTSGIGFVLNQINISLNKTSVPGLSSTQLKVAYYPIRGIGIGFATNFFARSHITTMTNCFSISFRNGL